MNICFFYPSKQVGGAQLLLFRLANILSKEHNILIIDYENGFLSNQYYENKINLILFENSNLEIPHIDVLISFPSKILEIQKELRFTNNPKLFLWHVHPHNMLSIFNPLVLQSLEDEILAIITKTLYRHCYKVGCNFYNELLTKKSLVFMDSSNKDKFQEFFPINFTTTYLPIPIICTSKRSIIRNYKEIKRGINFYWLGRLSSQKIPALTKAIFDICNSFIYDIVEKINIYVIGKNENIGLNFDGLINKKVSIIFLGELRIDKVEALLLENCDILFAMGTSALEGAKFGIPTILLNQINNNLAKSNNVKYDWLYNTEGFSLGRIVKNNRSFVESKNMDDVLKEYILNNKLIAQKCFDYVNKNHSIYNISKNLFLMINISSFTINDLYNYNFSKSFLINTIKRLKYSKKA